jgi:hypothetical protein
LTVSTVCRIGTLLCGSSSDNQFGLENETEEWAREGLEGEEFERESLKRKGVKELFFVAAFPKKNLDSQSH